MAKVVDFRKEKIERKEPIKFAFGRAAANAQKVAELAADFRAGSTKIFKSSNDVIDALHLYSERMAHAYGQVAEEMAQSFQTVPDSIRHLYDETLSMVRAEAQHHQGQGQGQGQGPA